MTPTLSSSLPLPPSLVPSLPLFPLVTMNWLKALGNDLCAMIIATSLVSAFKNCDFNF